jgi:hypothetical protein
VDRPLEQAPAAKSARPGGRSPDPPAPTGRDRACHRAQGAPERRSQRRQSSRMDSSPTPCDGRSSPSTGIGTAGCSRPANHPTPLRRPHSLKRRPERRRPAFQEDAFSTSAYHPPRLLDQAATLTGRQLLFLSWFAHATSVAPAGVLGSRCRHSPLARRGGCLLPRLCQAREFEADDS